MEYSGKGKIFEGLAIWKEEKHRNLQGICPVIFLSFAGIKASSFSEANEYDVVMEPKNRTDKAMVMEFKVRDSREEKTLEDTADAALKQIKDQRYETALKDRGISEDRIRRYGFASEGKEVLIKSV